MAVREQEPEDDEDDGGKRRKKKKPWRYRWPDEIRDDVLARLLALNAERAKEEADAAAVAAAAGGAKPNTAGKGGKKKPAKAQAKLFGDEDN